MTEKDNLMYLIEEAEELFPTQVEAIADHLIASGVTIQRWIPVTERLPEESGEYLVATRRGNLHVLSYSARHKAFNAFDYISDDAEVRCSHWMPLPEPPKEVE